MVRWGLGLFAMPGIVFHELAHLIFCKLVGARVHKVVFFQFGNPAGYVLHTTPTRFSSHFAIVVGPFVINSAVAYAVFRSSSSDWAFLSLDNPADLGAIFIPVVALWWGISIALQAFPSNGDARNLWHGANAHLRKGNLLALAGYPMVMLIYAANFLRFARVDLAYAVLLFVVASAM